MKLLTSYALLNDDNPVAELLHMIERKAPMFLRSHLGGVAKRTGHAGVALSEETIRTIRRRVAHGEALDRVASDLDVHYQTVAWHTRDIRAARRAVMESAAA